MDDTDDRHCASSGVGKRSECVIYGDIDKRTVTVEGRFRWELRAFFRYAVERMS